MRQVPQAAGKKRLVYILAASHSGSTLLAMLLGAHPEIATAGELKLTSLGNVEQYRCSCRNLIRECPFWNGIKDDMARKGFSFDVGEAGTDFRTGATRYAHRLLRPLHRGAVMEILRDGALRLSPTWRAAFPKIQARNAALVSCISDRAGKPIVVDSSKIALRLKYLLRNDALDVKVIRLIRDGRAVALTYTDPARFADASDPTFRGGGAGGDRESERISVARASREWRRSNEEAESLIRGLAPTRWREIRYEELCADPRGALGRLHEFMGTDNCDCWRWFRRVEHHVIGNGMRLDATEEVRSDERWRDEFVDRHLRIFESIAGPTNRRLGYE